jgi:tetratricopeptide (TPR) repeat protein
MPKSNSPTIVNLRLAAPGLRLVLLIPLILAGLCGWFSIRWLLGNTIAEAASTGQNPNIELTRMGVRWAPSDPFVHWRLGVLVQREFNANNLDETARDFQSAVQLSPNDFRYWDELGRALEATGNSEGAELALRRSTELAPEYSYPRWHFGNLLLREGKLDEAFANLFRAASANAQLWPQVLNLAWQVYDGDVNRIANEACKEPGVRITFAVYLVGVKRFDDAVRLWTTLSVSDRKQLAPSGRELRKALFEAKQYHAALEITRDIEEDGSEVPQPEQFSNGDFEKKIIIPVSRSFGWTIGSGVQAQMSIQGQAHSGLHSLRIVFSAPNKLDRINAAQTIVVQPNTQYHLECYARTEKLSSATTPVIAIIDSADSTMLGSSAPLPTGTNDWQKFTIDFKTKNGDGITVLIGRLPCSVGDVCPIFGTVWYDDFNLQRGGSSGSSR